MRGLCEGPSCRDKPSYIRRVGSGTGLCVPCRGLLSNHLTILPDLYQRCEVMLVNTHARGLERIHGGLPGGINLNDAAVVIRTDMVTVLASWASLVVDERRVARPQRRDVRTLTDFLGQHLEWLADHAAASDAATEIAALVRVAEDTISPDRAVRMELGPCDRSGCDHIISVTVRGDGDPAPNMIRCEGGHVWPPRRWLLLKHKIERARHGSRAVGADRAEPV
jgi:hypothetical protein